MSIDFSPWTRATAGLLPGQQAVFLDFLNLVAEGKAHLVHGANYRDGKPCLVNGTAQMLSTTAVSPTAKFPEVVMAFDAVCAEMQKAGLSEGQEGYVSPLMAEFLVRNFGEVKPMDLTDAGHLAALGEVVNAPENAPYIEPSDAEMQQFLKAMEAPAPEVVHEDDYARSFVNVEVTESSDQHA